MVSGTVKNIADAHHACGFPDEIQGKCCRAAGKYASDRIQFLAPILQIRVGYCEIRRARGRHRGEQNPVLSVPKTMAGSGGQCLGLAKPPPSTAAVSSRREGVSWEKAGPQKVPKTSETAIRNRRTGRKEIGGKNFSDGFRVSILADLDCPSVLALPDTNRCDNSRLVPVIAGEVTFVPGRAASGL